jgi:hypothetical protein
MQQVKQIPALLEKTNNVENANRSEKQEQPGA